MIHEYILSSEMDPHPLCLKSEVSSLRPRGGCTHQCPWSSRRLAVEPRIPTTPARSKSGFHPPVTDYADIASAKRETPWRCSARGKIEHRARVAWKVSCILLRTACAADFLAYGWKRRMDWIAFRCYHFQRPIASDSNEWGYSVTASDACHKQGREREDVGIDSETLNTQNTTYAR